MKNKAKVLMVTGSVLLGSLAFGSVAFAQTAPAPTTPGHAGVMEGRGPGKGQGVFGTVSAISGTSLTVTSKGFGKNASTATTYTVDVTNAKVTKGATTSTLSSVSVGDTVMVQGTVNGASVVATAIRDGVGMMGRGVGKKPTGQTPGTAPASIVQGNGQPVVGGTVTAVSGSAITIATTKGSVTYTVDASKATIEKVGAASTVSAIVVGDTVVVQGTVSGTSVTASSVIDQGAPRVSDANTSIASSTPQRGGMMGAIGGFFQHLFGFF